MSPCRPSPVVDNLLPLWAVVLRGRDTVAETDVAVTGGAPGCLMFSHGCVTARGHKLLSWGHYTLLMSWGHYRLLLDWGH